MKGKTSDGTSFGWNGVAAGAVTLILAGVAAWLAPLSIAVAAEGPELAIQPTPSSGAIAAEQAEAARAAATVGRSSTGRPLIARTQPAGLVRPRSTLMARTQPAAATRVQPAAGSRPIIHTDNIEHDFGEQWAGPDLKHAFTIQNRGDAPLQITKVDARCGCTVAGPYPTLLQPGESGDVPFTLRTTGFQGPFAKGVAIRSNDPVTPVLSLRLRGTAKRRIEVLPQIAAFGVLTGSEPVERVLKVKNNTDTPLQLKLTGAGNDQVKFELKETVPGQEFELRATAEAPFKPGPLSVAATLETNIAEEKLVQVRAVGRVPERLDLYPPMITYAAPTNPQMAERPQSRWLWLNNYGDKPVNILEATADDPALKVSFLKQNLPIGTTTQPAVRRPGQPLESYRIQIELPGDYNPPPTGRTISLKTDDPDKPVLEAKLIGSPTAARTSAPAPRPPAKRPAEYLVNQPVPAFNLETLDGKPISSTDLAGRITVLNFVAPNCGFCKKQIPIVEAIRSEFEEKGIRFVNISEKMGTKEYTVEETRQVMDSLGSKIELAMDPGNTVGQTFKAISYPTMFVVAKDAKIAYVNVGSTKAMLLKDQIEGLLSGKPVPQEVVGPPPAPATPQKRPAELLVNQTVPTFKLETLDGKPVSNEDLTGRITVLNFIAPNCGFCKKQIPTVEATRAAYEEKGIRFVNISERMGPKEYTAEETKQVMDSLGSKIDLALDPGNQVGRSFKATGYPTMFVIGKDGKVAHVNVGWNTASGLKGQLDRLLDGSPAASTRPAIQVGG